jgi:hypothetical protein
VIKKITIYNEYDFPHSYWHVDTALLQDRWYPSFYIQTVFPKLILKQEDSKLMLLDENGEVKYYLFLDK